MSKSTLQSGTSNRWARERDRSTVAALVAFSAAVVIAASHAAHADQREAAERLLARTMTNPEFKVKSFRGGEWLGNGDSYLALEPSAKGSDSDIVRYQTATGGREILVAADRLVPAGEKTPLAVESYRMSPDGHRALIFTNSKTAGRQNTRRDYWVLTLPART